MPIDLQKILAEAKARTELRTRLVAQRGQRERPLRQVMKQTIPFLHQRPSLPAQSLTDVAVRLAEVWEDPDFFGVLSGNAQAIEAFNWSAEPDPAPDWTLGEILLLTPGEKLGPKVVVPHDPEAADRLAIALIEDAMAALGGHEIEQESRFRSKAPVWVRAAVIEERLRARMGYAVDLQRRVRFVDPETAAAFVARHHSALPEVNPRGALYDLGLKVGGRLVAVATVTTPTGALPIEESAHLLEISRIASDASVYGAASALTGKVMELVDASRRYNTPRPGLLVTYSLLSELGTSYKALEAQGLRPVAFVPAKKSQAETSSRTAIAALANVPKIRWEFGAEAAPADKTLLRLVRPYRKKAVEDRRLTTDDLKPLNVERLRDLHQALFGSRPRTAERATLVASLLK